MLCRRACDNVAVLGVKVLVDLRQAALHIPQRDHAQAGRSRGLALVLILEDPVHALAAARLGLRGA